MIEPCYTLTKSRANRFRILINPKADLRLVFHKTGCTGETRDNQENASDRSVTVFESVTPYDRPSITDGCMKLDGQWSAAQFQRPIVQRLQLLTNQISNEIIFQSTVFIEHILRR